MEILIFLIAALTIGICSGDHDVSFEAGCTYYRGTFVPRTSTSEVGAGDRCEKAALGGATETEELAKYQCEQLLPHHIYKVELDEYETYCYAETGLICKKGWVQMYGRCYQMKRKMMTRPEAGAFCESLGDSRVAFLHRDYIGAFWHSYYRSPVFWVDASSAYRDYLIYNEGPDTMMSFDPWYYRVKSNTMIRVNGTAEKAHVLCEYTPVMTREESNYLARRYAEIYHPGFTNGEGLYVRTASHLVLDASNPRSAEKYCQDVMKPFVWSPGSIFNGAYPSKQFLTDVANVRDPFTDVANVRDPVMHYFRTPAQFKARGIGRRNQTNCGYPTDPRKITRGYHVDLRQPSRYYTEISGVWARGQPKLTCDAGFWSTTFRTSTGKTQLELETFSDARPAPMYCQMTFGTARYGPCPTGYSTFERSSGQKWCHKAHSTPMTLEDSERKCAEEGGFLDGFDSLEEYRFMNKMKICDRVRFGARRRPECMWAKASDHPYGYMVEPEHICSRRNVFQWQNGVAGDPPNIGDIAWAAGSTNPSYLKTGGNETCLEHYDAGLNDNRCDAVTCFYCGQEAPKILD